MVYYSHHQHNELHFCFTLMLKQHPSCLPSEFQPHRYSGLHDPAINGKGLIFNSTIKAGSQIHAFVLTSSIAAFSEIAKPEDHAFPYANWNGPVEKMAREYFLPIIAYGDNKVAAEKDPLEMDWEA